MSTRRCRGGVCRIVARRKCASTQIRQRLDYIMPMTVAPTQKATTARDNNTTANSTESDASTPDTSGGGEVGQVESADEEGTDKTSDTDLIGRE
ncbi:hypothetical protein N7532_001090 [Penicillium argentinense]|uniref:Uncharacterized protein n=1 Tax=Penicillium argentinense TaxID=1131581 RepID=A0A9W9G2N6_9EURO|nr:uncharacterized protein N7532_001090 [Penicillium argentinense]KAJ5110555.1 hypothetical protein N7532_001090 [Penicillium argentinense]